MLCSYENSFFVSKAKIEGLRGRINALEYRLDATACDIKNVEVPVWLLNSATEWNQKELCREGKAIDETEFAQLKEVVCYPKFLAALQQNRKMREDFFKWALHNHLNVSLFVQFPLLCKKIDKLKGRIGESGFFGEEEVKKYIGGEEIKFDPVTKEVSILMNEGDHKNPQPRYVSLHDQSQQIHFSHDLTLTLKEALNCFDDKNLREGPLTFFKGIGITNFHAGMLGPVDGKTGKVIPVDISDKEMWLDSLRYKRKGISFHEMRDILNEGKILTKTPFTEETPILTVVVARSTKELTEDGAHACLKMYVPRKAGNVIVWDETYAFGKYALDYPGGRWFGSSWIRRLIRKIMAIWETFWVVCGPVKGTILSPDPNDSGYTHRNRKYFHCIQTKEQGRALRDSLRRDIAEARLEFGVLLDQIPEDLRKSRDNTGGFTFQLLFDNCTKWNAKKLKHYVGKEFGHIFDYPFLKLQPKSAMLQALVKAGNLAPPLLFPLIYIIAGLFLGTWRSKRGIHENGKGKDVSLARRASWKAREGQSKQDLTFYHPATPAT